MILKIMPKKIIVQFDNFTRNILFKRNYFFYILGRNYLLLSKCSSGDYGVPNHHVFIFCHMGSVFVLVQRILLELIRLIHNLCSRFLLCVRHRLFLLCRVGRRWCPLGHVSFLPVGCGDVFYGRNYVPPYYTYIH